MKGKESTVKKRHLSKITPSKPQEVSNDDRMSCHIGSIGIEADSLSKLDAKRSKSLLF